MKSEKKLSKKKKLIAGIAGIVIVLGFILYGVIKPVYAWDIVTWSEPYAKPTKPWTYSTVSYAHVYCTERNLETKIYANDGNNGFTRKETNNTVDLEMAEDGLFNYLNWDDLEYGDIIYWEADADVTVRYNLNGKVIAKRTYTSVEGNKLYPYEESVIYADYADRSNIKDGMYNARNDFNFDEFEDTGSLFFGLVDANGDAYAFCHGFFNNHYTWRGLKESHYFAYKPTADFIIHFVDENGKKLAEPIEDEFLNKAQGVEPFTYDEAKEELDVEGTKYKLKNWSCKGTDGSTQNGTTATAEIKNEIKRKHYRMVYTITFVYTADEHNVKINYETEDGELLYSKEDTVADGKDYTYTADKVFIKDDTAYEYQKATWMMGTAGGKASTTTITVRECTDDVTITCIYKKTEDHLVTIDYVTEDGILFDSFTDTVEDGETYAYTAKSSIASGNYTYTFISASWEMGVRSGTSGTSIRITDCTDDIYITCVYAESVVGGDCNHEFGPWTTVTSGADGTCSRTCILCGYETPAEKHNEVETSRNEISRDESTGDVTTEYVYTCEKEEGGCGDTWTNIYIDHKCVLIEWLPDEPHVEWWLEYQAAIKSGSTYADFGYKYDPDIKHWRYCQYSDCTNRLGRERGPEDHVWETEYTDEGDGYLVRRCKKCRWIRDLKPVVVSLTLDPMGGILPKTGNSETYTFENIEFGSIVDLGVLGSDYFPEKESMTFTGFAYFASYNDEGYMYTPNQTTKTMTASSKFFIDLGNGKYKSNLKKDWTVNAQWRAAEYEVVYHADNDFADGSTTTSYHKVGTPQKLSQNNYYSISNITYADGGIPCKVESTLANTMVSAEFKGWNKTSGRDDFRKYANGEKPDFEDEEEVLDLLKTSGVVNLYGVWDYGSIILPNAKSTDDGYKLSAWRTEDGTEISVLNDSGNYTTKPYAIKGGDETLTAVWVPNEYTVTFDSNGGTPCNPKKVVYKQKFGTLPTPTKTGYTFKHWVWKVENKVIDEDSVVEYAINYELTADWERNPVTVTLDYNFDFGTAENTKKNPQISYTTKYGEEEDEFDGVDDFAEVDSNTDKMMFAYDSYYGKLPKPERDGYTFAGWYFEEDSDGNGCGEQACLLTESGSRITNPDNHTIYARWIQETTKVNLDYNREHSVWED